MPDLDRPTETHQIRLIDIKQIKRNSHRDLLIFAFCCGLFFIGSLFYDPLEYVYCFSRDYEQFEVDELFATAIFAGALMCIYAWRRNRELHLLTENLERQKRELEEALTKVKELEGIIPICSFCKKIRDDQGYWRKVEEYISTHSKARFSHGVCPECAEKYYEEIKKI